MVHKCLKICLFSAVSCICATFATAGPTDTPQKDRQHDSQQDRAEVRVAVLQNGSVLRGRLVPEGEFVKIQTEGAAIRLRQSEILFDAASLLDAYEQQRKSVDQPTAAKHLELAEWSMQQGLWPQAARELLDARGLDATHPRIALLERRLTFLSSRPHRPEPHGVDPGAEAKLAGPKLIWPQKQLARSEADTHLQKKRLNITLPPGTLELFTRRVQPMLVNNCTSVGCHREEGPCEFQLSRALLYGESNQRTTRKNLQATLEFIDLQMPIDSQLLTIPLRTHGGTEGSIFPPHRRQLYDQLVAWVKLATSDEQAALADTQPQRTLPRNSAAPIPTTSIPATKVGDRYAPASGTSSSTFNSAARAAYFQPRSARRGAPRIQFGARHRANQTPRPLDPETLSRRITSEGASEKPIEPIPQVTAALKKDSSQQPTPQPIVDTSE